MVKLLPAFDGFSSCISTFLQAVHLGTEACLSETPDQERLDRAKDRHGRKLKIKQNVVMGHSVNARLIIASTTILQYKE